ncbi:MAG: hypothetical protein AB7P76_11545 [Candidatus Melainabacteria bacterium]
MKAHYHRRGQQAPLTNINYNHPELDEDLDGLSSEELQKRIDGLLTWQERRERLVVLEKHRKLARLDLNDPSTSARAISRKAYRIMVSEVTDVDREIQSLQKEIRTLQLADAPDMKAVADLERHISAKEAERALKSAINPKIYEPRLRKEGDPLRKELIDEMAEAQAFREMGPKLMAEKIARRETVERYDAKGRKAGTAVNAGVWVASAELLRRLVKLVRPASAFSRMSTQELLIELARLSGKEASIGLTPKEDDRLQALKAYLADFDLSVQDAPNPGNAP